jgi:hypothetical protein
MRNLDLQRLREAKRRLTDRLWSELKGSIPQQRGTRRPRATVPTLTSRLARFAWRTGADHVTTVDGGADARMGLLPEAITLALLLALGRQ